MANLAKQFKAARRVSVPLVAIRTADPASVMKTVTDLFTKGSVPVLCWNVMHGLRGLNEAGKEAAAEVIGEGDPSMVTGRPTDALSFIEKLPKDVIVFFLNAQRFWKDEVVAQGIWNLRGLFKAAGSMLVMITSPGALLPQELTEDILVIDEALPTMDEMTSIVKATFDYSTQVGGFKPSAQLVEKAADALVGLASFPAEQALAMSLTKEELDVDGLWERKRQAIEQTPGLSVWRGGESFDDIGGCENIKKFIGALVEGKEPPRIIVFIDEIEKAFAGSGTDMSGVKTDMTGTMLTWMQDTKADGMIFIGPPGAAKSVVAKATGNRAKIPTIAFDLSAMQSSLVGSSGERLRAALKVIFAISQGRALFIATCNSISSLPPELRRRFKLGTFFFDLPTQEERAAIWKIYLKKYNLDATQELPDDEGWTGAEIEGCCMKAYRLNMTLLEAAEYVVPVSKSAAEQILTLRKMASGKFISGSEPGVYIYHETTPMGRADLSALGGGRRFREDA